MVTFFVGIDVATKQLCSITIPSASLSTAAICWNTFGFVAAAQNNSQWCWAASIQMVLNYYGVSISQEQIVARTYGTDPYGNLPNWAGSFQAITANLNNWNFDNLGRRYVVMASLNEGAPTPAVLLQELSQGRPVIVGYRSGQNSGHAIVITAASFSQSPTGPIIHSIVARDPWPSSQNIQTSGRVEYPGAKIASLMQAYWYIRVQ
jgi:hypothetical protein